MSPRTMVGGLAPVDLAELNAAAELQTRVDRKYMVPAAHLGNVLAGLPRETRVLDIDGRRALRYESHYFDTPGLDSYFGAAHRRRRRFKVRSRTYVDSELSFLEVKTRGARATTVKERVPVTGANLDAAARDYAADTLTVAGIPAAQRIADELTPVLRTRYRRITLLPPVVPGQPAARATVDVALEWADVDGTVLQLPDAVIVETKSGSRAGDVDRLLWSLGHRPAKVSKYGTGMAALRPELPRNAWNRVLTRHFDPARAALAA